MRERKGVRKSTLKERESEREKNSDVRVVECEQIDKEKNLKEEK